MSDTNTVVLTGRLTKDVETKELKGGTIVAKTSLASNRVRGSGDERKEETVFVEFYIYGNKAKYFADTAYKGGRVLIQGRLKTDKWDDKNGGGTREKTFVEVDDYNVIDRKPKDGSGEAKTPTKNTKGNAKSNEEDIPF